MSVVSGSGLQDLGFGGVFGVECSEFRVCVSYIRGLRSPSART